MTAAVRSGWLDRARTATAGPELFEILRRRLTMPRDEGPALDERNGEGVEDVFINLARQEEDFRGRLDETIAGYLHGGEADPGDAAARPVIRGLLEIVAALSLPIAGSRVRAWLAHHDAALRAEADAILGRAALDALATAQVRGTDDGRRFWSTLWKRGPAAWWWRVFIGLRLQDPRAAAAEIPELLSRLEAQGADPGPMLLGMWKAAGGAARAGGMAAHDDRPGSGRQGASRAEEPRAPRSAERAPHGEA
jgi:hypothetical protein